jgi:hypothetical protein
MHDHKKRELLALPLVVVLLHRACNEPGGGGANRVGIIWYSRVDRFQHR